MASLLLPIVTVISPDTISQLISILRQKPPVTFDSSNPGALAVVFDASLVLYHCSDGVPRGRHTVKKVMVVASLLIGFFGLNVRTLAAPQEGGPEIRQKVSKTARKAAIHAQVHYSGSPQFTWIIGTSISYATNTSHIVLKIGDAYYFLFPYFNAISRGTQEVWLVSATAEGPWVPADSVPEVATGIVCGQINTDPSRPYQVCALPW